MSSADSLSSSGEPLTRPSRTGSFRNSEVYNKYIRPGKGDRGVRLTDRYLSLLDGVTKDQIPALYKSLRTKGSEEHVTLEKYKRALKMSEASAARWSDAISKSVLRDVLSRDPAYQKQYLKAARKAEKAARSSKNPTAMSTTAGSRTSKASSKSTPKASSVPGTSIDSLPSGTSTLVTAAA